MHAFLTLHRWFGVAALLLLVYPLIWLAYTLVRGAVAARRDTVRG